jgi:mannose-6-phosphate isomerase-like protein (cupin superfamily)
MQAKSIDLASALASVHEHWRPKTLAALNDHEVKVARFQGEFVWHLHEDEDELFVPLRGTFRVEFRDHVEHLSPGQVLVVPRGVEHRPVADVEVECLLVQRAGVRNTGNVVHPTLTAPPSQHRE